MPWEWWLFEGPAKLVQPKFGALRRGIARGGGRLIADNNTHETPHQCPFERAKTPPTWASLTPRKSCASPSSSRVGQSRRGPPKCVRHNGKATRIKNAPNSP